MNTSDQYLPSVDGWRAIAIILVMLSHWWASVGGEVVADSLPYVANQGDLGVRIFFVISGFLITLVLLRENMKFGNISLRNFYARRILRIMPAYFAFLAVLGILTTVGLYKDARSSWIGSLTFTRNVLGQGRSATDHLWSLAVEEQFYLLWPITMVAFRLARRSRWAWVILSTIVVIAFGARLIPCDMDSAACRRILGVKSAIKYADSLSIGCLAAYVFAYMPDRLPRSQAPFFTALIALIMSTLVDPSTRLGTSALIFVQAFLTAICLIASITTKPKVFHYVLNTRIIASIGILSYSLYIWHPLFLSHYMGSIFAASMLFDWKVWPIAALVSATVSYYFFERPITGLRRRFQVTKAVSAEDVRTNIARNCRIA